MHYVAASDINIIHDQIIREIGGSSGLREAELLKSIALKPQASFGGRDLYIDLASKAAALFEALCNYHVFVDGNKRTAALVLYRYLCINGQDLTATNKQLEQYTLSVASSQPDLAEVAAWIKAHSREVSS